MAEISFAVIHCDSIVELQGRQVNISRNGALGISNRELRVSRTNDSLRFKSQLTFPTRRAKISRANYRCECRESISWLFAVTKYLWDCRSGYAWFRDAEGQERLSGQSSWTSRRSSGLSSIYFVSFHFTYSTHRRRVGEYWQNKLLRGLGKFQKFYLKPRQNFFSFPEQ